MLSSPFLFHDTHNTIYTTMINEALRQRLKENISEQKQALTEIGYRLDTMRYALERAYQNDDDIRSRQQAMASVGALAGDVEEMNELLDVLDAIISIKRTHRL